MDTRYTSLLLAVLVISGAVYIPSQRTAAPPPPAQSIKSKVARVSPRGLRPAAAPSDEAVSKVHEFLQTGSPHEDNCVGEAGIEGEFLLATVPNPYSSPHAYIFDAYVESIQRAAGASSYDFDSYWFPWSQQHAVDGDTVEERRLQAEENQRLDKIPGVLLFRREDDEHRRYLLIVFLISETPISGVNKPAFLEAVEDARHLFGGAKLSPIRVLGPSFSGSIPSLKIAMQTIALSNSDKQPVKFWFATGAATNSGNADQIKDRLTDRYEVRYDAVVADDELTIGQFLKYLKDSGKLVRQEEIAIVSESNTAYGRGLGESNQTLDSPQIPSGISLLRNAYQNQPNLLAPPKPGQAPPQSLTLTLKDPTAAKDIVPKFAPQQTAVSQETALLNILSAIKARGVKFVGVALTDVLDNLFVAQLLQKNCPDVRLFLLEPDLLFQHSEQGLSFDGALMVSTYPLFLQNERWTGWRSGEIQFPTQGANGVYNAARVLLARPPTGDDGLINYTRPLGATDTPPLWLTAVGREGTWPIALLLGGNQQASSLLRFSQSPFSVPHPLERPSRSWSVAFLLVIVLVLGHNGFCIYHNWNRTAQRRNLFASFEISSQPEFRRNQSFFLLIATLSLLALYLSFAMVLAGYFSHNSTEWQSTWFLLHAVLAVVVAGTLVMVAIPCIAGLQIFRWRQQPFELAFAVASIAVMLFLLGWFCAVGWQLVSPQYEGLFFVFRSIHPGSGLAAFLPVAFLLAVFYLWALTNLRRLRLSETRCPALPVVFSEPGCVPEQVNDALNLSICGLWEATAVSLLFVLTVFLAWRNVRSLETAGFDQFYAFLVILIYGLLLFTAARFLTVWRLLKAFLHRLNWHPIGTIVARLPKDVSWLLMLQSGGMEQAEVTLARSRAKLSEMLASPGIDNDLRQRLSAIEPGLQSRIAEFLRAKSCGKTECAANFIGLQTELQKISELLIANVLMTRWPNGDTTGLAADEEPGKAEVALSREEFARLAEEFVALRFVAFIRYVMLQLRNYLAFLSVAFLLTVISFNSYPFEPHHTLTTFLTVVFFILGAFLAIAFVQMSRDSVLRRLGNEGKLSGAVIWRGISFGGLPLITILASQFPTLGGFLFSWVQPALEAVR